MRTTTLSIIQILQAAIAEDQERHTECVSHILRADSVSSSQKMNTDSLVTEEVKAAHMLSCITPAQETL
jgi:hypothetical protein